MELDKAGFLKTHFFAEWMREREKQWDALSKEYPMFCVCGKLATGFHERHCKKFQKMLDNRTVAALKHLIPFEK